MLPAAQAATDEHQAILGRMNPRPRYHRRSVTDPPSAPAHPASSRPEPGAQLTHRRAPLVCRHSSVTTRQKSHRTTHR